MASVANTNSSGAPSASSPTAAKAAPIAHEASVIATGARAGGKDGKRELFKESTTTALVFPNGGVIRLPIPVNPGQLIFLSIPQTKREVVAQVTKRRDNPGAGYYIELEFTEPAPDFWGVKFGETPEEAPANVAPSPAAQIMQAPPPATAEPDVEPPPPTEGEVHALMEEVEALRAELKSLQTQSAPANSSAPAAASSTNPAAPPATQLAAVFSSFLVPRPDAEQSSSTASAERAESSSAAPEQPDSSEDSVAKPQTSEKKNKSSKKSTPAPQPAAPVADRSGTLRLALLAAVSLFAVFAAAWNMHLLPWASGSVNVPGHASAPLHPAAASHKFPAAQQKSASPVDANATAQPANSTPTAPNSTDPSAAQPTAVSPDATSPNASQPSTAATDSSTNPAPPEDSAPVTPVAKRSIVPRSSTADAAPIAALPDNATGIVPPELVKSVRAVAPADALRHYVTGNVTLDAVIDKTGHVQSMKVLSGPPSFHKPAMDALREYRYKPATRNGKPVAAHVTVTVPFWFEP